MILRTICVCDSYQRKEGLEAALKLANRAFEDAAGLASGNPLRIAIASLSSLAREVCPPPLPRAASRASRGPSRTHAHSHARTHAPLWTFHSPLDRHAPLGPPCCVARCGFSRRHVEQVGQACPPEDVEVDVDHDEPGPATVQARSPRPPRCAPLPPTPSPPRRRRCRPVWESLAGPHKDVTLPVPRGPGDALHQPLCPRHCA